MGEGGGGPRARRHPRHAVRTTIPTTSPRHIPSDVPSAPTLASGREASRGADAEAAAVAVTDRRESRAGQRSGGRHRTREGGRDKDEGAPRGQSTVEGGPRRGRGRGARSCSVGGVAREACPPPPRPLPHFFTERAQFGIVVSEMNNKKRVTKKGRPARTAWQGHFDGSVA